MELEEPRGFKRRRTEEPLLEPDLPEVPEKKKRKRTTKKGPRRKAKPSIKSKLLTKLRARKKVLTTELKAVERDIRSLVPRRKKKEE